MCCKDLEIPSNRDWKRCHTPEIGVFSNVDVFSIIYIVYQFIWPLMKFYRFCESDLESKSEVCYVFTGFV